MDDAIKRFRQRRTARLGYDMFKHYDSVKEYRRRRAERLAARMDADGDDENTPAPKSGGGRHGNTKIPFGLCQREGIEIQPGWTPEDAWKALEGKGYSAGDAYKELKETGKVSKKTRGASQSTETGGKDFGSMDYDALAKEYEDHNRRYKEAKDRAKSNKFDAKKVAVAMRKHAVILEKGEYKGESYEEVVKGIQDSMKSENESEEYRYRRMKDVMDVFGHDAFKKSKNDVMEMAMSMSDEATGAANFSVLNEERAKIQKAMAARAKDKYKNISDCDTSIALEARMRGDDFFVSGDWLSGAMAYHTIDQKTVSGIGKAMDSIKDKFPEMKGLLHPMLINDTPGDGAYAHCEMSSVSDAQVVLNSTYFKDAGALMGMVKNDVKSGFHPKGTANFESIVTHEYGHAIDDVLTKKYATELGGREFHQYVLDRLKENHPRESEASLMRKVSRYSLNNSARHGVEFLAEAMSEYCSSNKPRPIATEVGQIMKEFMQNPKSALEPRKPKTSDWGWAPPDDDEEDVPLF